MIAAGGKNAGREDYEDNEEEEEEEEYWGSLCLTNVISEVINKVLVTY